MVGVEYNGLILCIIHFLWAKNELVEAREMKWFYQISEVSSWCATLSYMRWLLKPNIPKPMGAFYRKLIEARSGFSILYSLKFILLVKRLLTRRTCILFMYVLWRCPPIAYWTLSTVVLHMLHNAFEDCTCRLLICVCCIVDCWFLYIG